MKRATSFHLERPRLDRRVEAALAVRHLALIAPPGYGKTVLLRRLAAHRPNTYYLPLALADTDPTVVQARCQHVLEQAPTPARATLMLDDIHHLEQSPEAAAWLCAQVASPTPRLILAGRRFPCPDLKMLHLTGALDVLTGADLAFTAEESRMFLAEHNVDASRQNQWQARAAGWPLALALLVRGVAGGPLPHVQEDIFDYLAAHQLRRLPLDIQRFWRLTAIPLRFNVELAGALLGDPDQAPALLRQISHYNLFLEAADRPHWFRYHDLIREFLLAQSPVDLAPTYRRIVSWFQQRGDWEMAIEHALAGKLWDEAAAQLEHLPGSVIWDHGRYRTFRRWVLSLPEELRDRRSKLLVRLGQELTETELRAEGWTYLRRGLEVAEAGGDQVQQTWAKLSMALAYVKDAAYAEAEALCRQVLDNTAVQPVTRLRAFYILGNSLIYGDRFPEARLAYRQALALAIHLGNDDLAAFIRHNLTTYVLIPLGHLQAAEELLATNEQVFDQDHPNLRVTHLFGWCEYHRLRGDWTALAHVLNEIDVLADQVELAKTGDEFWTHWFQAMAAMGQDRCDTVEAALLAASACTGGHPEKVVCLAWARCWLARRKHDWSQALSIADTILPSAQESPFYRGVLALERSIALGLAWLDGDGNQFAVHPAISVLVKTRAHPYLIRLRALLSLVCHRQGVQRWRRHASAVLRGLRRYGLERTLTAGDPDLGARFWAMLLAENLETRRAARGLATIGDVAVLEPLLRHPDPDVRVRAAGVVAAMDQEAGLPLLLQTLDGETDPRLRASLEASLRSLEQLPPPRLHVRLMDGFAVQRGADDLPDTVWPRPVVRRLFQYFALHKGQLLPREHILDDLWPDTPAEKAWTTFRSVYSRLRKVLEPYLRVKSESRYFAVMGDAYRFDPHDVVETDVAHFESAVQQALAQAVQTDAPPIPSDLIDALEGYASLLPELPLAEWLLPHRERLQQRYLDGCLYLAQASLVRGQAATAAPWAERAIAAGPWLEDGYRLLMRALARQGQRSRALKVYAAAVAALRRELDAPPSERLTWLATRLRQGEEI